MKVRQGFVSNSSSSSFIVFGTGVSLEDIGKENIWFIGDEYGEGDEFFPVEGEFAEYIKEHGFPRRGGFINNVVRVDGEDSYISNEIKAKLVSFFANTPVDQIDIRSVNASYHQRGYEDLIERYYED